MKQTTTTTTIQSNTINSSIKTADLIDPAIEVSEDNTKGTNAEANNIAVNRKKRSKKSLNDLNNVKKLESSSYNDIFDDIPIDLNEEDFQMDAENLNLDVDEKKFEADVVLNNDLEDNDQVDDELTK